MIKSIKEKIVRNYLNERGLKVIEREDSGAAETCISMAISKIHHVDYDLMTLVSRVENNRDDWAENVNIIYSELAEAEKLLNNGRVIFWSEVEI